MKKTTLFVSLFTSLFVIINICAAGNLDPSAAPGSTMKPLDQVEPRTPITALPFTISQSGSYYLTKNLTATGTGITVSSDDVTIDLCGFTINGPGAIAYTYGIVMSGKKNVEIRNGTIRNFGYDGIAELSSGGSNLRITGVKVISNTRHGIYSPGAGSVIKDCVVNNNGGSYSGNIYGILTGGGATITGNTVHNNGTSTAGNVYGIYTNIACKVIGNTLYSNGASATVGVYLIYTAANSIVSDNTIYNNGTGSTSVYNVYALNSCTITNNNINNNAGYGIYCATQCHVLNNNVTNNSNTGIAEGDNCLISDNVVISNSGDGISGGDHVTIKYNTVSSNSGSGIACTGGYVAKNTVSQNNTSNTVGKAGIAIISHSQIKENTLEGNAKNNILVSGSRSSVEGNVMSGSDYGINFTTNGNIYRNNLATANGGNNLGTNTDGGGNVLAF